jgi:N,N-dimethylformamidase
LLAERPELGLSSYDQYADGTDVVLVSQLRPNLNMRPDHARREGYMQDLELVAWLDHLGEPFDVATDQDLDREGATLLAGYRTVLTGTHPEYVSAPMWEALDGWVRDGGRLFVLGGNALMWTVAFHPERPWIMEVRKPEVSPGETPWRDAETCLAFTGAPGGDGSNDGRAAERLIGVGTASMGFDAAVPYERLPASDDPRAAFVFAGVEDRTIGAHGTFGGVVTQEWDRTDPQCGTPSHALVLARSGEPSAISRRFGAVKQPNHAELTFFETPGGGAVLTVASLAWCSALADDG